MTEYAVGIDVGGTKIAAGVVDARGKVLSRFYSRAHAGMPPAPVIDGIAESFHEAVERAGLTRNDIAGVGLACTGHINGSKGIVLTSSNLSDWKNVPLRDLVRARIGCPVVLENDANCAALAEYRFGAGRGSRHMSYVTFSTGYGMGIIADGKLLVGSIGTAGEIGHTIIQPGGALCACGKRGCVMAYACGLGLSRMARERIAAGEPTILREWCGSAPEFVSGETISQAARQGDCVARELIETAGRYFGYSLANVVELLNPEVIVVGGGLARIGPMLMDPCLQTMRENVQPVLADSARVVLSELWDDAGMIGAAALVQSRQ